MISALRAAWYEETHVVLLQPEPPSPAPAPSGTPGEATAEAAGATDDGAPAVLTLRHAIGALACALPLLITTVDVFIPTVDWHLRNSLSAYYYAGSRELFTGGLAATGALLIAFKALDRRLEFWLTLVAGVLAIFVSFFPTKACDACGATTALQQAIGADTARAIHYASAMTMIGLLAVVCMLWAALEQHTGVGSERFRALHIASAVIIGIAVLYGLAMFIANKGFEREPLLFDQELLVVEWVSVWAFAASWLFIGPAYEAKARGAP